MAIFAHLKALLISQIALLTKKIKYPIPFLNMVIAIAKGKIRYRYMRPKRRYSKAGGGGFKPIMDGLIAGVAGQLASKWVGAYGLPLGAIGVGLWRKNATLKTEGARELGIVLGNNIPFLSGGATVGGFE